MRMNQKGFSMTELLVAVAVLALVAVPVFSMMVVSARYTAQNDLQADCLRMAENEMERQKAMGTLAWVGTAGAANSPQPIQCLTPDAKDGEGDDPTAEKDGVYVLDGKTISVTAEPLENGCYTVTVTVGELLAADEIANFDPIVLKGVCVYESIIEPNTPAG